MASKDPAFLFYSKDWIEGTAELSPAEKGVYIDLLCYQHQKSDLPSDLHRICRLVRLSYDEFLVIWNVISDKFYVDGERMFNIKLSEVMSERSLKGKKNKIIGIFASLLRKSDLSKKEYSEVRSSFKVDDFMQIDTERLTERLTEWYELRLKSIANEDANVNEDINTINIEFDVFWNLYNKKVGDKKDCIKKWNKLTDIDRQKIIDTLPKFLSNIKDKQFQAHPSTYLNQERWNDEIQIETTVKKMVM